MRKLGSASTDPIKGIATIAVVLYIISGASRFTIPVRATFCLKILTAFVLWYFEYYVFYEKSILVFRPSKLRAPKKIVDVSSVHSITFHKHLDLATGTIVYIHFDTGGEKDMIAFNFRRRHLFILEFAAINNIAVDTGKIEWIERARLAMLPPR
jgi:hypothetical protein